MPYQSRDELPEAVQTALQAVPHAQDIYQAAYNSAYEQYSDPDERRGEADREEVAHRVAWSAVKEQYAKGSDGLWHPKENL